MNTETTKKVTLKEIAAELLAKQAAAAATGFGSATAVKKPEEVTYCAWSLAAKKAVAATIQAKSKVQEAIVKAVNIRRNNLPKWAEVLTVTARNYSKFSALMHIEAAVAEATETVVLENTIELVTEANDATEYGYVDLFTGEFIVKDEDPLFKGQHVHFKTGTIRPVLNKPAAGDNTGDLLQSLKGHPLNPVLGAGKRGRKANLGAKIVDEEINMIATGKEDMTDVEFFLDMAWKTVEKGDEFAKEFLEKNKEFIKQGMFDPKMVANMMERVAASQKRIDAVLAQTDKVSAAVVKYTAEAILLTDEEKANAKNPALVKANRAGWKAVMGSKPNVALDTVIIDAKKVSNTNGEGLRAVMAATETGMSALYRAALFAFETGKISKQLIQKGGLQRLSRLVVKNHTMDCNAQLVELAFGRSYDTHVIDRLKYRVNGLVSIKIMSDHKIEKCEEYAKQLRKQGYIIIDGEKYIPLVVESNAKTRLFDTLWTREDLKDEWMLVMNMASAFIGEGLLTETELAAAFKRRARLPMSQSPSWEAIIDFSKHGVVVINDKLDHIDGQGWGCAKFMGSIFGVDKAVNGMQVRTSTSKGQITAIDGANKVFVDLVMANRYFVEHVDKMTEVANAFANGKNAVVVGNKDNIVLIGDMNFFKDLPRVDEYDKNGKHILRLNLLKNATPTRRGSTLAYQAIVGACCQYRDANGNSIVLQAVKDAIYAQMLETFKSYLVGRNVPANINELIAAIVGKDGLKGNARLIAELAMKGSKVALKQLELLSISLSNEQQIVLGNAELNYNKTGKTVLFNKHMFLRDGIEYAEGPGLLVVEIIVANNSPLLRNGNESIIMLRYPHANGYSFVKAKLVTVKEAIARIENSHLEDWVQEAIIRELRAVNGSTIMTDGSRLLKEALGGMDFDIDAVTVLTEEEYTRLLPIDQLRTIVAPINTTASKKKLVVAAGSDLQEVLAEVQYQSGNNDATYVGQVNGTVLICTEYPMLDRAQQEKIARHMVKNNSLHHDSSLPVFDYKEFIKYSDTDNGVMIADECCTVEAMQAAVDKFINKTEARNYSVESLINFAEYVVLMSGPCQGFIIDAVKKACPTIHLGKEMTDKVHLQYKKFKGSFLLTVDDKTGHAKVEAFYKFSRIEGHEYSTFGSEIQKELFEQFKKDAIKYAIDVFAGDDDSLRSEEEFGKSMVKKDGMMNICDHRNKNNKGYRDLAGRVATVLDIQDAEVKMAFEGADINISTALNAWGPGLAMTAMLYGTINSTIVNAYKVGKYFRPLEMKAALKGAGLTHIPVKLAFLHEEAIDYAKAHVGQVLDFEKDAQEMAIECNNCPGLLLPAGYKGGKYEIAEKFVACRNKDGEVKATRELYALVEANKALGIEEFDCTNFVVQMNHVDQQKVRSTEILEDIAKILAKKDVRTEAFVGTYEDLKAYTGNLKVIGSYKYPSDPKPLKTDRALWSLQYSNDGKEVAVVFYSEINYCGTKDKMRYVTGPVTLKSAVTNIVEHKDKEYHNTYMLMKHLDGSRIAEIKSYVNDMVESYATDFRKNVISDAVKSAKFGELLERKLVEANKEDKEHQIPTWFDTNKGTADDMIHAAGLMGLGYSREQVEAIYGPVSKDIPAFEKEDLAKYVASLLGCK